MNFHCVVYRGMGRQKQLMWVGIAGFWGAGVPLGYALAFPAHLALSGLWLGQLAGSLVVGKCMAAHIRVGLIRVVMHNIEVCGSIFEFGLDHATVVTCVCNMSCMCELGTFASVCTFGGHFILCCAACCPSPPA